MCLHETCYGEAMFVSFLLVSSDLVLFEIWPSHVLNFVLVPLATAELELYK